MKPEILFNLYNSLKIQIYGGIIIFFMFYTICFYKLFQKENINKYFALIPIYNFYLYFKMISLPFVLFFIPVLNIITLFLAPYKLAKRYDYNRLTRWIVVLLQIIYVPYICFNNKENKYITHSNVFVENNKDIDDLERKLEKEAINEEFEAVGSTKKEIKEHPKEKFIDDIEKNVKDSFEDEIIYEEQTPETPTTEKVDLMKEDIEELEEESIIQEDIPITTETIEELDTESNKNIKEKIVETDKQSLEDIETDKTIAFGGKELVDKYSTETKNDELKCPRCGSSLVGARGVCPGCGLELKNEPLK